MIKCRYVQFYDGVPHPDLEKAKENNHYRLNEIEGRIDFCESNKDGLIIRLSNHSHLKKTEGKTIVWKFDKERPIPALCGQGLRCFYKEAINFRKGQLIHMEAYKLLENLNSKFVIRRGITEGGYKFVEE